MPKEVEKLTLAEITKFVEMMNVKPEDAVIYAVPDGDSRPTPCVVLNEPTGVRLFYPFMIRETLRG